MCKKPFDSFGVKICPKCSAKIDKDFITVRDYIYDNEYADMDTVSEETGVDKAIILYLLKEGRLELSGEAGGGGVLVCEVCKKPINTGRMCPACKDSLSSTMKKSVMPDSPAEPERKKTVSSKRSSGMHTRPTDKK